MSCHVALLLRWSATVMTAVVFGNAGGADRIPRRPGAAGRPGAIVPPADCHGLSGIHLKAARVFPDAAAGVLNIASSAAAIAPTSPMPHRAGPPSPSLSRLPCHDNLCARHCSRVL